MSGFLDRARRAAEAQRAASGIVPEMSRILSIPGGYPPSGIDWTAKLRLDPNGYALFPLQQQALDAAHHAAQLPARGLFLVLGVGSGKTGIGQLLPKVLGAKRPLLLHPAYMREQMHQARRDWGASYRVDMPALRSYAWLSQPTGWEELKEMQPDLIIADECHYLKSQGSARTKRFLRYFRKNPGTRFVGMTGTITNQSLLEYAHLIQLALRQDVPLPLSWGMLQQWASVLDQGAEPDRNAVDALVPLVQAYPDPGDTLQETARRAYRGRLRDCRGVLVSKQSAFGGDLVLRSTTLPLVSQHTKQIMDKVSEHWEDPEGNPLVDAKDVARILRQLSSGFYYRQDAPVEWRNARNQWNAIVRHALKNPREGRDSPKLVEDAVRNGWGLRVHREALAAWDAVRGMDIPPPEPVWVDRGWLRCVVVRFFDAPHKRGLLWYNHRAVGEYLEELGLPVFGEGTEPPGDGFSHTALSIHAHGTGRNLQAWDYNMVIEPPASGSRWEQLLGRTHRPGQKSSAVFVDILRHTDVHTRALIKAKEQALYIESTTGMRQKLNLATLPGLW